VESATTTKTRLEIHRDVKQRVLGGVAAGLGRSLGIEPVYVRAGFVSLGLVYGLGLVLYLGLWAILPEDPSAETAPVSGVDRRQRLGLLLVFAGAMLVLRGIGLWPGDVVMVAGSAVAFGLAALWDRSEGSRRRGEARLLLPGDRGERSVGRLIVGGLLLLVGLGLFAGGIDAISGLGTVVLAALVTAAGVTLVLGPWLVGLARDLGRERTERIRQEERAEMAAHLHDSVLQTLALMQRTDDPRRVVTLARAQERELRRWLYEKGPAVEGERLVAALRSAADRVEADFDVPVEVVAVGDSSLDDPTRAMLGAAGEAMTNSARHSGAGSVSVYLEVGDEVVDLWVTDQGKGFDPDGVPPDRQGIAASIVARMRRHGGTAEVRSEPGEGTEVHLRLEHA
jgi:phage shock protein PspC (stress-responsive transcriptional regulator)/two-component sensor histidine kinase